MRTIIINTMGKAYSKKDIYFLSFKPEDIVWINCDLCDIGRCVKEISSYKEKQTTRHDYHLVVMALLNPYKDSEYEDMRDKLRKLLRAYITKKLLIPLDESDNCPSGVSEIFVCSRDHHEQTPALLSYSEILGIGDYAKPEKAELVSDSAGETIDFSDILSGVLEDYSHVTATAAESSADGTAADDEPVLLDDRVGIADALPKKQEGSKKRNQKNSQAENSIEKLLDSLSFFRPVRDPSRKVEAASTIFLTSTEETILICADLQIGLANIVRKVCERSAVNDDTLPKLCKAHSVDDLSDLFADASGILNGALNVQEQKLYYPMKTEYKADNARLRSVVYGKLAGLTSTVPQTDNSGSKSKKGENETVTNEDFENLIQKLVNGRVFSERKILFSIKKSKARFHEYYSFLQDQYDEDGVSKDEKTVFDTCADSYNDWRIEERSVEIKAGNESTESRRPELPPESEAELIKAREQCSDGTLEKLECYEDVREDAEEIYDDFRSVTRVWSSAGKPGDAFKSFFRFSSVMGVIFVLLMILPFFLIGKQETGYQISRFVLFLLDFAVFTVTYVIGVLAWMRSLCKKIGKLNTELLGLIAESRKKRIESIRRVITVYTEMLPQCLDCQNRYDTFKKIDKKNQTAMDCCKFHRNLIREALDEVKDVRSALQLDDRDVTPKKVNVRYDLPPYDKSNRPVYMLFEAREK